MHPEFPLFPSLAIRFYALLLALAVFGGGFAGADLVSIQYFDSASTSFPGSGGPLWTGVVDTVTNKLRIDTWTELPGHGEEFWAPASLPMVWDAVGAGGAPFDVPDTFGLNGVVTFGNDANPATDFAFISPVSLQAMPWHPFDSQAGEPDTNQITEFVGPITFFPGWGGVAFLNGSGDMVYRVAQTNPGSTIAYDYRMVEAIPVSSTAVLPSTAATVTVTERVETLHAIVTAVPELSASVRAGIIAVVCVVVACVRRKHPTATAWST